MNQIFIDVSDLPAPEPFQKIMAELTQLNNSDYLKVVHRKEPLLLYRPLDELGFDFHVQKGSDFPFEIFIWSKNKAAPMELILPNLADKHHSAKTCSD